MWNNADNMDAGAMGVQITISGKLRGERSGFEKTVRYTTTSMVIMLK